MMTLMFDAPEKHLRILKELLLYVVALVRAEQVHCWSHS